MTAVLVELAATTRLAELGLSQEQLARVVLRADAEAKLCTDLDPPTLGGMSRFGKTVRFLREELIPKGWDYDNSFNYCRTIHPSAVFSIVPSSGDEGTGVWIPGQSPSTKYPKGETTTRAVEVNGQLELDLGPSFDADEPTELAAKIWYLLYRVTVDQIFMELSLPTAIDGGMITDWEERIILSPVLRHEPPTLEELPGHEEGGYSVDVARR